ncbi:hypothetical protein ACF3NG_01660 [Aerococcaceae bacterium WGS1372]
MRRLLNHTLILLLTILSFSPTLAMATARPEAAQIKEVQMLDLKDDQIDKEPIPWKQFEVTDNAKMSIKDDAIILDINNENGALKIEGLDLDTETRYAIHYTYQKLDGRLNSFGGHTDGLFLNNLVAVDGKVTSQYTENDSAFIKDDKEEHEVIIEFLTPRDKASAEFFIQPNRGDFDYVTLKISDIYLVEIPEEE